MFCYACHKDCHQYCPEYATKKCRKYDSPPYVCNACENRRYCDDDRYFYDARVADRQALAHIFAVHEDEIPVTCRTAYTYIAQGRLDVRNLDLRRQASYNRRRKKKDDSGILNIRPYSARGSVF